MAQKKEMNLVNVENSQAGNIEASGNFQNWSDVARDQNIRIQVFKGNVKINYLQPQVGGTVQKSGIGSTKRDAGAVQAAGGVEIVRENVILSEVEDLDLVEGSKILGTAEVAGAGDAAAGSVLREGPESTQKPNNPIIVFDRTSKHLQSYDPEKNSWKRIQAMNEDMVKDKFFTAAVLHPHIYALLHNKAVYRVDHTKLNSGRNATWERMADRKFGNVYSASVLNGFIYAVEDGHSSSVEKYDPANNEWVEVVKKNKKCFWATLVSARGNLYCIGGCDGKSLRDVEKFDPTTSTWSYVRPMNEARCWAAAVEVDDKIYVMGGWDNKPPSLAMNSVECYDIDLDSWTKVVSMKMPRSFFSACVIGRKIFVVGGDESSTETIEMLDHEGREWEIVEIMEGMKIEGRASVAVSFDPQ